MHQLGQAGARRGRPREPGVPQVVQVEVGPADCLPDVVPDALEIAGQEGGAGRSSEEPGLRVRFQLCQRVVPGPDVGRREVGQPPSAELWVDVPAEQVLVLSPRGRP